MSSSNSTGDIRSWRSIVTLIVFVITNVIVIFPFHIPIFVPRPLWNASLKALVAFRIIPPRESDSNAQHDETNDSKKKAFVRLRFPLNFLTAPLIADLFLLAILAIGRQEVHDGTIGANHIAPIDIMIFFLTLAYIAISIDASGLIRYLAFKVLQKGGSVGHRLFFYLYSFFFLLGSFIGNDPIILSGTAFLSYMTRVSSNIVHPRAWIHTQFAVANIASAILVSSNPTNLVLAGAFEIKFINYTANIIVPVVGTAVVLFPFLLYIVFADETLIPMSIKMHELSEEAKAKKPINPNIPHGRGKAEEDEIEAANGEESQLLSLEEIMNPFLDKGGAAFGAVIMTATLVTLLALNAASQSTGEHPVFYVTLPAAVVMFCWDVSFGWIHRRETRETSRKGRAEIERVRAARALREEEANREALIEQEHGEEGMLVQEHNTAESQTPEIRLNGSDSLHSLDDEKKPGEESPELGSRGLESSASKLVPNEEKGGDSNSPQIPISALDEKQKLAITDPEKALNDSPDIPRDKKRTFSELVSYKIELGRDRRPATLVSLVSDAYRWSQETFPTAAAVMTHLPFALVPFAFTMFILVEALVTKGWVPVFAHGWDHWVNKTGTVGSIGAMGFLSVILCNFAGTNIGATILISRVIQAWQQIHKENGLPISSRTFWGTVYSMAMGVNYGAFSIAFSASLAGLLWRDILGRKHIKVRGLDFARVNLPIIAIAMAVGLAILVGEIYVIHGEEPYDAQK